MVPYDGLADQLDRDHYYQELLIGTWKTDFGSVVDYSADGIAIQSWLEESWTIVAEWEIEKGSIYVHVKYSTHPNVPVGAIYKDKILRIDENELVYLDSSGIHIWEKIKSDVYRQHTGKNPININDGYFHVRRGGSWFDGPNTVRSAVRAKAGAGDATSIYTGFRLVVDVEDE
jgi:hypothetical protein